MDVPASSPAPLPAAQLRCTQCGSELHPDEGQLFITCARCNSTVYLDKSRVVFHYALAPTVDAQKARGLLAQWMAGNETVKDLDKKSQVIAQTFEYFPLWYFKSRAQGREEIMLEPAAAISVSELRRLNLPAGDLRRYDPGLEGQAHAPTVPLQTALGWLQGRGLGAADIVETALVHVPLYTFKYVFNNKTYTALVEAATGKVFANVFPAKAEAPYRLAGCASALVFCVLAFIPLIGAASVGDASGYFGGLAACLGLGCLAAPILFAFAAWVAAKV
jgi:DNA-directed RNA polymerase subunit RPC12/RpoP